MSKLFMLMFQIASCLAEVTWMKRNIGTFVLRFAATVVLLASDGVAREPNSVSLCPPSLRMTEHDGCQPSNGSPSGNVPAHVKNDAAELLWREIVALVNNTPTEIQYCVWSGPLRRGWTLDGARSEISKCQSKEQTWQEIVALVSNTPSAEVRSCVSWARLVSSGNSTPAGARAEISRCEHEVIEKREHERQRQHQINIAQGVFFAEWIAGIVVGVVSLVITIRFRAKIAAGLYKLFVGCLSLRLRFDRARKRFLDNAIKAAEKRLG
jgi:hypothetical protein